MHKNLLFVALLLWAGLVTVAFADGNLVVTGAWIRTAPPNAPVLAGYMTMENRSSSGQSLVSVTSSAFGDVMMHRTDHADGVAHMTHLEQVNIAAHGKRVFQPDGYHLMLMQPKRPLRAGDRIPMDLRFADGSRLTVSFTVREQGMVGAGGDRGTAGHGPMTHGITR